MISKKNILYSIISIFIYTLFFSYSPITANAAVISDGVIELVGGEEPSFSTALISGDTLKSGVKIKNNSRSTDLIVVLGDEEITIKVGEELVLDGDWEMESIGKRSVFSDSQDDTEDADNSDSDENNESNKDEKNDQDIEETNASDLSKNDESNKEEISDKATEGASIPNEEPPASSIEEISYQVPEDTSSNSELVPDLVPEDSTATNTEVIPALIPDESSTTTNEEDANNNDNALPQDTSSDNSNDQADITSLQDENVGSVIIDANGNPTGYVISSNVESGLEASYVGSTSDKHSKYVKVLDTITSINGKTYSVTSITDEALKNASGKELTIGKNVKSIGKGALFGSKYKKITVKTNRNGSLKVGKNAFKVSAKKANIKVQGVKGKNKVSVINRIKNQASKGVKVR
ncbi:hypothetical protein [Butyrivibrio sp. WCD3002]|uniref:hypothetical protein n=1 Tax=Butyrivibrio sp. WCD3002 TaxID=1280676 RepID=UPI0003F7E0FD|nr:hypothetical protein [Butyrivibrio sp. WCD3002]